MTLDLGITALHKMLTPRTYTIRCKVVELGTSIKVQSILNLDDEIVLSFWAKPLLPMSFSYEVDDEVIVEIRSMCEAYVLGLANDLEGVNTEDEFCVRFGKNVLRGRKDGTNVEFTGGDGNFRIEHNMVGTTVETSGVLSLIGDAVSIGDGMALGLNCMTVCPLQGMHIPTQQKVMF